MLQITNAKLNQYFALTCEAALVVYFKDENYYYELKTTTVSPYMSGKLYEDIKYAVSDGWSIMDIADLCDTPCLKRMDEHMRNVYERRYGEIRWNEVYPIVSELYPHIHRQL